MKKYLIAASALTLGLAMSSAALASADDNVSVALGGSSNQSVQDNDSVNNGNDRGNNNTNRGDHRNNTNVDVEVEIEVDTNNSTNGSVIANQSLSAFVSDTTVSFADAPALINLADGGQDFNTGSNGIRNSAFRSFAGVATVSMDSSVGSVSQAATNIAAGANNIFN